MEKLRWLRDRMVPGLRLTQDLPENHVSEKCPKLDFQVWVQETEEYSVIRHTFFQKATTSPLVFHAQGGYGWKPMMTTLSEEQGRRFTNMDMYHTDQEILEVVKDFLQKLADSGYNHNHRVEIIRSWCRRFSRRET